MAYNLLFKWGGDRDERSLRLKMKNLDKKEGDVYVADEVETEP